MTEKVKRAARRPRKEILIAEIEKIESRITDCRTKIKSLTDQKSQLEAEIKLLEEEEAKAAEEAQNKEIINLIRKKGLSLDEIKAILEKE